MAPARAAPVSAWKAYESSKIAGVVPKRDARSAFMITIFGTSDIHDTTIGHGREQGYARRENRGIRQPGGRTGAALRRGRPAGRRRPLPRARRSGGRPRHGAGDRGRGRHPPRSEEHTSELQSLRRISYAVFCLKKKKTQTRQHQRISLELKKTPITTRTKP